MPMSRAQHGAPRSVLAQVLGHRPRYTRYLMRDTWYPERWWRQCSAQRIRRTLQLATHRGCWIGGGKSARRTNSAGQRSRRVTYLSWHDSDDIVARHDAYHHAVPLLFPFDGGKQLGPSNVAKCPEVHKREAQEGSQQALSRRRAQTRSNVWRRRCV